ncbi:MAG: hypothetical protein ACRDOV_09880, partial [Streptomyces sp.]
MSFHHPRRAAVSLTKDSVSLTKDDAPTAAAEAPPAGGCLAIAVRVPVRIVTLLLILPVRMVWDALTAGGRLLRRTLWVPFARAMGRVWEAVLAPVLFALLIWPWLALWRYLLVPVGGALAWLAAAAGRGLAAG